MLTRLPVAQLPHDELKAIALKLGRNLRQQKGSLLSPKTLPHVPAFLQRLRLQDHDLFHDFCICSAKSWQQLQTHELVELLGNTHHYHLLHAHHGPALARLGSALQASVVELDNSGQLEAKDCAALTGALTHWSRPVRMLCMPLVESLWGCMLRITAELSTLSAEDKAMLLMAELQLHAHFSASLQPLPAPLGLYLAGMAHMQFSLATFCVACARLYWSAPNAAAKLMEGPSFSQNFRSEESGEVRATIPVLPMQAIELPAAIRHQLWSALPADLDFGEDDIDLTMWLRIMRDMPSYLLLKGQEGENVNAAKELINKLLQACAHKPEASIHAQCTATMATSGIQIGGKTGELTKADMRLVLQTGLTNPKGTPWMETALNTAIHGLVPSHLSRQDVQALQKVLDKRMPGQHNLLELRSKARAALFRDTVEQEPVWQRTHPRGYSRYLESCIRRGRKAMLAVNTACSS